MTERALTLHAAAAQIAQSLQSWAAFSQYQEAKGSAYMQETTSCFQTLLGLLQGWFE